MIHLARTAPNPRMPQFLSTTDDVSVTRRRSIRISNHAASPSRPFPSWNHRPKSTHTHTPPLLSPSLQATYDKLPPHQATRIKTRCPQGQVMLLSAMSVFRHTSLGWCTCWAFPPSSRRETSLSVFWSGDFVGSMGLLWCGGVLVWLFPVGYTALDEFRRWHLYVGWDRGHGWMDRLGID